MGVTSRVLAILFLCVALATCKGGAPNLSSTSPEAAPAGHSTPAVQPLGNGLAGLPAPQELLKLLPAQHAASFTMAQGYKDGAEFNSSLPNGLVSPSGTTAFFAPDFNPATDSGLTGVAYCIYHYILLSPATGALITFNWQTAPNGGQWLYALASFDANRWDWFAGPTSGWVTVARLKPYMTAADDFFLVIAAMGSNSCRLTDIQIKGVEPPLAQLTADVNSGTAPLSVRFDASGSHDPDGTITDYEWDFDGDGSFSETGAEALARGASQPAAYIYRAGGDYDATVLVTDNDGAQALASVTIHVSSLLQVELTADVVSGDAPLTVTFTAAASDPGSGIANYEWDFDGDGVFGEAGQEAAAGGCAKPAPFIYDNVGVFPAEVRVTSNAGAQAFDSVSIAVRQLPQVELSAQLPGGPADHIVQFTATASAPGGMIVDYEWDFDGDLVYNEPGDEIAARNDPGPLNVYYQQDGKYSVLVRATDDAGRTAEDSVLIKVGVLPHAVLLSDNQLGEVPLSITFDGSRSYDEWGTIIDYEWDFDGDQLFNETHNGEDVAHGNSTPPAYIYVHPGQFRATLRVTDDNGASDRDTLLTDAHGWEIITIDDPDGVDAGYDISMVLVDQRPAIAHTTHGDSTLRFTRSSTYYGADPADWTTVTLDNVNSPLHCNLASIIGNPAISFYRDSGNGALLYLRSTTPDGGNPADWISPVEVDAAGNGRGYDSSLGSSGGHPAIAYYDQGSSDLRYAYCSTANGNNASDWSTVLVDDGGAGAAGWQPSLSGAAGSPAIAYCATAADSDQLIRFVRSSTATGAHTSDWSNVVTVYHSATSALYPSLGSVEKPAIAFQDGNNHLCYVRSTSFDGGAGSWNGLTTVDDDGSTGAYACLRVWDTPLIAYYCQQESDLRFARSSTYDGDGSNAWQDKQTVMSSGSVGRFPSVIMLSNNRPAIAFRNDDTQALMYAIGY